MICFAARPQSRGVAGTLFVHKIAGALANRVPISETVTEAAERGFPTTHSIGMSLVLQPLPGSSKSSNSEGMARACLGIHGEAGFEQIPFDVAERQFAAVQTNWHPR